MNEQKENCRKNNNRNRKKLIDIFGGYIKVKRANLSIDPFTY
jgi:hypothetical protein